MHRRGQRGLRGSPSPLRSVLNRENGEHPINDSAEVQRVTAALGVQSLQLPKIGVDLENIAADLAEAQRAAAGRIATLESQLQRIDDQLDQALELEHDPDWPRPKDPNLMR